MKKLIPKFAVTLFILIAGLTPRLVWAGSKLINVQGKLTDNAGNPLSGTRVVTFRLYTSSMSPIANAVWTENQGVTLQNGLFNISLGNVTALDSLLFNTPYFLGMQVLGDVNELQPRQLLGASAYSLGSLGNFDVQGILTSSSGTIQNLAVTNLNITGTQSGLTLGRIKQIVYGSETAGGSTNSGSFVAMGASATITPTSPNSKILVLGEASCSAQTSTDANVAVLGLAKNGTALFMPQSSPARITVGGLDSVFGANLVVFYQDSPSTTSPTLYRLMLAASGGGLNTAIMGGAMATGSETRIVLVEYL